MRYRILVEYDGSKFQAEIQGFKDWHHNGFASWKYVGYKDIFRSKTYTFRHRKPEKAYRAALKELNSILAYDQDQEIISKFKSPHGVFVKEF